ncbi:MAG: ATP-binding cassette domain-containing protein [Treponema sp.]|nr:ATP-binding cassette domain-containing protein [Treponema sp.]
MCDKNILLSARDLTKVYERTDSKKIYAVNKVNLSLQKGLSYGLVGESGCGKSTLGQMLVKLLEPTEGDIQFEGKSICGKMTREEEIAFRKKAQVIFQNPYDSLNPRMKIFQIIEEPLIIHKIGKTKQERAGYVNEIRTLCGLDPSVLEKYPSELSGGQRQRVCIAASMIMNPKFLVLDEAVSSLDVLIQAQILNMLKKLQKNLKLTSLFISHNLNAVSYLADVIFVMYLGNIVEQGPVKEIMENPLHPYTKALFSAAYNINQKEENRIVLHGELLDPSKKITGCPFASRCPFADDRCYKESPVMKAESQNSEHLCACWKMC